MVSANTPLLSIVELNPITGVLFITEKDYARLQVGQDVQLVTDAFAGETFVGRITRIAPVFNRTSRQARVELIVDNADHRLKPGMFIRATIALETVDEATIVPEQALTTRADRTGVFRVNDDLTVTWHPVTVGLREGQRIQVRGEGLTGRVVTLGQQLIDDGSQVTIPEDNGDRPDSPPPATEAP
jgi:RND family efflux transporter MFP subunit